LALTVWTPLFAVHRAAAQNDHAPAHGTEETAGGEVSPLAFDPDLAIFTAIVFVLLLVVLRKFAWGPISEALDQRERAIADNIAAAKKQNDDAKAILVQYEQKLAHAADEVRKILEEARRDADHTKQQILAEAQAGAETERKRVLRDIQIATDQSLKELSEKTADLAVDLAGKIVRAQLKAEDHAELIRQAMDQFGSAGPSAN
jgi:F-type H+-transporting ATPase subunit b